MRFLKKGGKLLGEGAYGCVFSPSLCSPNDDTKVSKVFETEEDAKVEMEQARELMKLDPDQKYFLYPTRKCEINPSQFSPEDKCRLIDFFGGTPQQKRLRSPSPFNPFLSYQESAWSPSPIPSSKKARLPRTFAAVEMRKGDGELGVYVEKAKPKFTRAQLLEMCMNVFEGVAVLQKHGMMHFDIKPQNIMVIEDGAERSTRLIDFGKMRDLDAGVNVMDIETIKTYPFYPPELRLCYDVYKDIHKDKRDDFIIEHERSLITAFNTRIFDRISGKWMDGLKDAIKESIVEPKKIDVYGIGMSLFILAKDLEPDRRVIVDEFDALVKDCICPDPKERITIDVLIERAKAIIGKAKSGGAPLRKTTEKVAIGNQMRVVYKGRHGKMYVRMKGAFVTLANARKKV